MERKVKKYMFISLVLAFLVIGFTLFMTLFKLNKVAKNQEQVPLKSEQLILGFSQIGSACAWRTSNTASIFEAAAENNIQILFDDAQQKQENQLKAIRSFIVYQVDVIAFVPIVETGWDNVLQEAKDAGIPVIIVDRQIASDPSLYAGFLGEDGFKEGKAAGEFLLNKIKNFHEKKWNVLELSGTANSSVVISRAEGFRSVIAQNPNISIIHSEDGDFLRSRGKEIMDRILKENKGLSYNNKPIDIIYSHNDSMTLGLLDSFAENNIDSKKTIIISIDAEQKSIDALIEGKLNCVVECNPNLGPTLMTLVKAIAEGKSIPRITYMQETVFTENDDFSTYEPRGY